MSDNPFKQLREMYDEQVKEADERGYADAFKKATDLFFAGMKKFFSESEIEINPTIQYLDGYYIFGHGTNSVVHYWLNICPDWKFGIWWDCTEENIISGEFFAQYEKEIDKFKPSASGLCVSRNIRLNNYSDSKEFDCYIAYEVYEMIDFIRKEPELAFCRDWCGWDYNREYHSREEAIKKFLKVKKERELREKTQKEYDGAMLKFLKKHICPMFQDVEIEDRGDNWSPRYCLNAPLQKNREYCNQSGWYELFDENNPKDVKLKRKFLKIQEKFEKLSDKRGAYISNPIHDDIFFYEENE